MLFRGSRINDLTINAGRSELNFSSIARESKVDSLRDLAEKSGAKGCALVRVAFLLYFLRTFTHERKKGKYEKMKSAKKEPIFRPKAERWINSRRYVEAR